MTVRPTSRMPHPRLFLAALTAGASFWPASHLALPTVVLLAWKGAGVALLAVWAARQARERDGWLLVAVLTLGAIGDVAIDAAGLVAGAAAFLAGHAVAIILYLPNHRRTRSAILTGAGIGVAIPVAAFAITVDPAICVYAIGLGAMAGTAWTSRFPRRTVALGALLFAGSDLLIFARLGPLAGSIMPDLLVWPLYFAGQALIAYGVAATLARGSAMKIFTIGYEGVTMGEFLAALQAASVKRVIDVRALPLSRRPGFSKSTLAASLAEAGIGYVHLKALGTPKRGRDAAKKGDRATLEVVYAEQLELPEAQVQAAQMMDLAREKPSALLCFERDPCVCHRTLLLDAVAKDVDVIDLFA